MNMVSKLLLSGLAGSALLGAAEPTAKAPVTRAALFKNGYALVLRLRDAVYPRSYEVLPA